MAIHGAITLARTALVPGDILIEYEKTPEHALLWLGGFKPIAHSAEADTTGILQQSANVLGDGHGRPAYEVYRPLNAVLAKKATDIATAFATPSNDTRYVTAKQQGWGLSLVTKYSQARLGGDGGIWGPEAVVRAVRAYHRYRTGSPLSAGEGVTCSQFVTYAYQAAAIAKLADHDRLFAVAIDLAAERGLLGAFGLHAAKKQGSVELATALARIQTAYDLMRGSRDGIDLNVPIAMQVNASVTTVDILVSGLIHDTRFAHVGNLAGDSTADSDSGSGSGSDSDSDSD